ncbi:YigZ family protein [Populibacterium corticicola]|uniref:YigZ family protein n=1 Tax=Populibacterium corticicola TaxID=1812826 RepID=A0ABW5XC86_9MICO
MTTYPSTIAGGLSHEIVIKKSRFIAHAQHVKSIAEADAFIASIKTQYWDARHNCTALIVGETANSQRSNDDGEPSGTAGIPMLEVLRHRNLTDLAVVVTRYFGGVLLGAGGLVRAYSSAVSETLDQAHIVHRRLLNTYSISTFYDDAGRIEHFLRDWLSHNAGAFGAPNYTHRVEFRVSIEPQQEAELSAGLAALTAGACQLRLEGSHIVDVPA